MTEYLWRGKPVFGSEMSDIYALRFAIQLAEAKGYAECAAGLRAILDRLAQPTDPQADLTERARAVLKSWWGDPANEEVLAVTIEKMEADIAAALQSEREAAAAEARGAAIQIARREHEEHIAARDDALAAGNEMGALTRARQAQTASKIARAICALEEETR